VVIGKKSKTDKVKIGRWDVRVGKVLSQTDPRAIGAKKGAVRTNCSGDCRLGRLHQAAGWASSALPVNMFRMLVTSRSESIYQTSGS